MKRLILLIAVLAVCLNIAFAQSNKDYVEVLRSQIQADKKAIVANAMQFSSAESKVFWPIYRAYDAKLQNLGDIRISIVEDYSKNYNQMSQELAKELLAKSITLEQDLLNLRKSTARELEKALSPILAARFLQVENQIGMVTDLQIASKLPLIREPLAKAAG